MGAATALALLMHPLPSGDVVLVMRRTVRGMHDGSTSVPAASHSEFPSLVAVSR